MTVYANISGESHTISNVIDGETIDGCMFDMYYSDGPVTYVTNVIATPAGTKYFEIETGETTSWHATCQRYLPSPITLSNGTTYYLGAFFRFQKIGGSDIWHNENDFDKLCGLTGGGFRWIINSGYTASYTEGVPFVSNKFAFTCGVACTSVPNWPTCGDDKLIPNQEPYDYDNPPYCDYSKWYAVVMGVTAYTNSSGRVRLWVNGNLTTDYSGQTMQSGANIGLIESNGTIGQGAQPNYNAPPHYRQHDGIILTDNWQDIINGGYLSDPESSPQRTLFRP